MDVADDPDTILAGKGQGDVRRKSSDVDTVGSKGVPSPLLNNNEALKSESRLESSLPGLEQESSALPAKGGLTVPTPITKSDSAESLVSVSKTRSNTGVRIDNGEQQLAEEVSKPSNDSKDEAAPGTTVVPESPSPDADMPLHEPRATSNQHQAGETSQRS